MAQASNLSVSWLASGEGSPTPCEPSSTVLELDILEEIITKAQLLFQAKSVGLRPEAEARIIRLVYEMYLRQGKKMDETSLNNLIELASFR